jgi:hypothetical protein
MNSVATYTGAAASFPSPYSKPLGVTSGALGGTSGAFDTIMKNKDVLRLQRPGEPVIPSTRTKLDHARTGLDLVGHGASYMEATGTAANLGKLAGRAGAVGGLTSIGSAGIKVHQQQGRLSTPEKVDTGLGVLGGASGFTSVVSKNPTVKKQLQVRL